MQGANILKWLQRWGTPLLYVVMFIFIVRSLVVGWDQIRDFPWQIAPLLLVTAFGLYVTQLIGLAGLWTWSVRQLDIALPYNIGIQMWLMAFLSRYIPGGVWSYAYVASSGRTLNLPVRLVTVTYALQPLLRIWVGALTIVPILTILFPDHPLQPDILFLLLLLLITLSIPTLLQPFLIRSLRLIRLDTEGLLAILTTPPILPRILLYSVAIQGILVLMLTVVFSGLVAVDAPSAVYIALAYAVSTVVGLVVVFMPQGIGVREGTFAWLAAPVMSSSVAVTISLGLRLLLIVYDLLILLTIFGLQALGLLQARKPDTPQATDALTRPPDQ